MPQKVSAQLTCRQHDSLELVNLYNATNGANWTIKWQLNTPINTWKGVILDNEGCVKYVELKINNLVGTIPELDLPKLVILTLVSNKLSGTIPNFNLPNLEALQLDGNQLTGNIPNFNLLPNLTNLSLAVNQLNGQIPNFKLPKLRVLAVGMNQLSGQIPNFDLPDLDYLHLHTNKLTGSIPHFNLPKLRILYAENNLLTGPIPPFNLPNLTDLYLYNNQFSGTIPNFNVPKLERLLLNDNQLSGNIPNLVTPKLIQLNFNNNQLSGEIINFISNLPNLPNLEQLSFTNNQLSGTIPNINLPNLRTLYLDENQLSGTIPNFNLLNVLAIGLNDNQLTGFIPDLFAPNLYYLKLNNNQLSGCITPTLKQYCGKTVDISGNPNLITENFSTFCNANFGVCATPDLAVSNLIPATPSVQQGQILHFKFDAKNLGAAATGNFTIKSYLSTDPILSANDYQDGVISTGNYAAGSTISQIQGAMTVNPSVSAGNYYVILKIDADNQIVESNENNNTTVSLMPIFVTAQQLPTDCLNKFWMQGLQVSGSNSCLPNPSSVDNRPAAYFSGNLQMYGTRIADGFTATVSNSNTQTRFSTFFATTPPTTTPPAGARFATCSNANWLYFTVNGVANAGQQTFVDSNVHIRVCYWGAENNPDYIYFEIDSFNQISRLPFLSTSKTQNCAPCLKIDRTPPVLTCPDTLVTYTRNPADYYINAQSIRSNININASDNCGTNNIIWGMKTISGFYGGFTYPIQLLAYDSAGNKSTCNFKIKIKCAVSNTLNTIGSFFNCPTDIVAAAIDGQNCYVNWTPPRITYDTESFKVTSNFKPYDCFPIGTTKVIYTAIDSCQNVMTCSFNVIVKDSVATCLNSYKLETESASKKSCLRVERTHPTPSGTLQQYGHNIADGFSLYLSDNYNFSNLFARNGTSVRPENTRFSNCTADNWVYFTAEGGTFTYDTRLTESENKKVVIRVRTFGNPLNADSIYVEVDSNSYTNNNALVSVSKTKSCDPCFFNDQTAPKITNCPTEIVNLPPSFLPAQYHTSQITSFLNMTITDSCFIPNKSIYNIPSSLSAGWRTVWDYKIIAFDKAGNKSVCSFTVRYPNPNCTYYRFNQPVFKNCPQNITVQATSGQTCAAASWTPPIAVTNDLSIISYADSYPIPLSSLVSNYPPNFCFPIGTTPVVYTATDSCGKSATCTFNVTVKTTETTEQDIALSLIATPSVYRQYATHNFKILAKNTSNQAFTTIKIDFPFPNKTVGSAAATPSVGTWSEWCAGGIQCFTWTIPSLAANTTATLDVPLYVLDAINPIIATARILSSNPVDNTTANNSATIIINPANTPLNAPLINFNLTELNPIIIQKINPTIADNVIVIELESIVNKSIDYQLVNAFGTTVLNNKLNIEKGNNKRHINVSELPKGMYFISINGWLNKFIKI